MDLPEKYNQHFANQQINIEELFCTKSTIQIQNDSLGLLFFEENKTIGVGRFSNKTLFEPLVVKHENINCFHLFLHKQLKLEDNSVKKWQVPNLNQSLIRAISTRLGIAFIPENNDLGDVCFANSDEVRPEFKTTFTPIAIFDYCYALLQHHFFEENLPKWTAANELKIPFPNDIVLFWKTAEIGSCFRKAHLLENQFCKNSAIIFPVKGSNQVAQIVWNNDKIWINQTQFFEAISEKVWCFRFGNYQPAFAWLKQYEGENLTDEDIFRFKKIISAIETSITLQNKLRLLLD